VSKVITISRSATETLSATVGTAFYEWAGQLGQDLAKTFNKERFPLRALALAGRVTFLSVCELM